MMLKNYFTSYLNWWTDAVPQGLSQLAENLDSLERGYLLAREEQKRLLQPHFDPERWELCPTIDFVHKHFIFCLSFLSHVRAFVCICQRTRGADLRVWTLYGRTESAGGRNATGAACIWGSSISTSSPHPVSCPLWGGRNSDSSTGSTTTLHVSELCRK